MGRVDFRKVHPRRPRAYAEVLGISTDRLAKTVDIPETELFSETAAQPHPLSAAAKSYRIPKQTVEVPDALKEAAEQYGHLPAFKGLNEVRWQHFMLSVSRLHTPEDAEGWVREFSDLRRMGYDPQDDGE